MTLGWIGGTIAVAVITALPGSVKLRVEAAYAGGTLVVCGLLLLSLLLLSRRPAGAAEPIQATALVAAGGAD